MKYTYILFIGLLIVSCSNKTEQTYAKNKPTIIPPEGITSGYFYTKDIAFAGITPGHVGILWAIHDGEKIVDVYFDTKVRPDYVTKKFAGAYQRLNSYTEEMAKLNRGIGWFNGVRPLELEWIKRGKLDSDIDVISGASQTTKNAMIPAGQEIQSRIDAGIKDQYATRIVKAFDDGTVGDLWVMYKGDQIVDFSYDELIPENTTNEKLKYIAGQSKKHSLDFRIPAPARYGFFYTADKMKELVLAENDLSKVETIFDNKLHDQKSRPKVHAMVQEILEYQQNDPLLAVK